MSGTISFEQDAKLVSELLELLTREQADLIKMDIDAIEGLLEKKAALLQRISIVANARYDALAANGYEAGEAGMLVWLQKQARPVLSKAWTAFQKELSQAKEMNRLNGMLINKHFMRNQQLLNQLQGGSGAAEVYGRDGQAKSQSTSRPSFTA